MNATELGLARDDWERFPGLSRQIAGVGCFCGEQHETKNPKSPGEAGEGGHLRLRKNEKKKGIEFTEHPRRTFIAIKLRKKTFGREHEKFSRLEIIICRPRSGSKRDCDEEDCDLANIMRP